MRSKYPFAKVGTHCLAFIAGIAVAWPAQPLWRQMVMTLNQDRYGLLVEQCDMAMREHYQAKSQVAVRQTNEASRRLLEGEIGLIVCQDYDIYQKRLLQWGLREDELAQMRLRAIEARSTDLYEVIETHEIRY